MQPGAGRLVEHQPGQPGDGQPVDDPALSWLAHGDGGDAAGGKCQQEQGEGGGDPLDDQRRNGRRRWW